jgi:hypothetical protein
MEAVPEKFKIRTAYNEFHVFRHQGLLELRSGDNSLQSAIDPRAPQRLCLRNLEHLMTVLLFIPEPRNILVLGTAAGSLLSISIPNSSRSCYNWGCCLPATTGSIT